MENRNMDEMDNQVRTQQDVVQPNLNVNDVGDDLVESTQEDISMSESNNFAQAPVNENVFKGATYYDMNAQSNTEEDTTKNNIKKNNKKNSGKFKKAVKFIGTAVAFGSIAGGVMFGVNALGNHLTGDKKVEVPEVSTVTVQDNNSLEKGNLTVADVAEETMPSIVAITNTSVQTVRSWFQSYEQEVSGSGSGFIIGQTDKEILIATNNHVVEGAKELTVAFHDETAAEATIKGVDSSTDLAVIAVKVEDLEQGTLSSIKVSALGSSDNLRVGDEAIAIGNALGYGQSVTVGYISAINREVDIENANLTLLQTDAAINPGNSGGALLNAKGEVIGINTVKFVDSTVEGMGYAIPISAAIPIINDLMDQEVIKEEEQGYFGIQGNDITDEYAQGFNMPKGVYVVKIVEGSPADGCGLKAGDIITKFANRDISSMKNLQDILSNKKAGEEVELVVQRNTEKGEYGEVKLKVVLGAKKDMPETDEMKEEVSPTENIPEESYPEQEFPQDFFDPFEDFYHGW